MANNPSVCDFWVSLAASRPFAWSYSDSGVLGVAATWVGGGVAASGEGAVPASPVLAAASVVVLEVIVPSVSMLS